MEPELVEIPLPSHCASRSSKKKEIVPIEVINLDSDEDGDGVAVLGGTIDRLNKGKEVIDYSNGYGHPKDSLNGNACSYCVDDVEIIDDMKHLQKKGSHALGEVDLHTNDIRSRCDEIFEVEGSNFDFMESGEDMDIFSEKYFDDYDKLQSHFDKIGIPAGIEAPVPWWTDISQNNCWSSAGSSSKISTFQNALINPTPQPKKLDLMSSSGMQGQPESFSHPLDMDLSLPLSITPTVQGKKSRVAPANRVPIKSFPIGFQSFKSRRILEPFRNKKMNVGSGSSGKLSDMESSDVIKMSAGTDHLMNERGTLGTGNGSYNSSVSTKNASFAKTYTHSPLPATSTKSAWWMMPFAMGDSFSPQSVANGSFHGYVEPFGSSVHVIPKEEYGECLGQGLLNGEDLMCKFHSFRQFDMVQGVSDHYFDIKGATVTNQSNKWLKRVQEEWKILEKDLPDSIFVRAYDARMDLMRAVMVGAEGTPYHDGLFFFDIYFPPDYPNVPPHVHYHSGGLRINPNLYGCGKVCLSLLNTWSGEHKTERWIPGTSTMLQVLVSIQGLILNAKPYFNEPGFACRMGTPDGENTSLNYNEDTFILSLRTMLYTMRRPPEHFKDFVMGHFSKRAHDIMEACRAYLGGAQVGSLVQGSEQKVKEGRQSSDRLRKTVSSYIGLLTKSFTEIGVKGCEKYTPTAACR